MSPRSKYFFWLARAKLLTLLGLALTFSTPPLSADLNFEKTIRPFFKNYCIQCHGPEKSKGKITLHTLTPEIGDDVKHWETILDILSHKEMPPEDETQPSDAERESIATWINQELKEYVSKQSDVQSEPTTRRLTNFEYENTVRDLIGFRMKLKQHLPEDPIKPYAFNNSAKYMFMGVDQLDRYKENARRIMTALIVDSEKPEIHREKKEWKPYMNNPTGKQHDELKGGRNAPSGGMSITKFPRNGEFKVRIKAAGIFPSGITEIPLRLVMGYNLGVNSSTLQVEPLGIRKLKGNLDNPDIFEFTGRVEDFPVEPPTTHRRRKIPESLTITPQNIYDDGRLNDNVNAFKRPRIVVKSMEFEAPVFEEWPPSYHRNILFESPLREKDSDSYVKEVLGRFITRAFRRPIIQDELNDYFEIYKVISQDMPKMEDAIRETLAMVLISPDFLFHTVAKDGLADQHHELASKLSYFLWGSMPDQELFDLALEKKLKDNVTIAKQVQRMLKDPKAKDFVRNFTIQWLSISKTKQVAINRDTFPRFLHLISAGERTGLEVPYIPTVRDYMIDETVAFVHELIRRNDSVLSIVDSDFAMLNERLAAHYGIKGVHGHELRPVSITPEDHLGGLLTHGSVLVGNSNGTAPHPIYRAVWLREAILGDEVKDPPAEVPALTDSVGESVEKALSIKELLELHRKKESCNDCHVRLDPWGIPFERYNAIGQFQPKVPKDGTKVRKMQNSRYGEGETVEAYQTYLDSINTVEVMAEARVPHGPRVDGLIGLKRHLIRNRKDDIAKNMVKRLMTYGMGRELTYHDRYEVEKIFERSKENHHQLQDLIVLICQNQTFLEN